MASSFKKDYSRIRFINREFEKWRAIRASVGSVGRVLAWVAC